MRKLFVYTISILLFLSLMITVSPGEIRLVVEPEKPEPNEEVTLRILNESRLMEEIRGDIYDPDREKFANIFPSDRGVVKIIPKKAGDYWVKIRDHEEKLYFTVRKEMWFSGPNPENPRIGECISLGVPRGVGVKILDAEGNLYKTCTTKLGYLGGSSVNFTIEEAGTYQMVLGELSQEWWAENFTLMVRAKRKLEINLDPEKAEVGKGVIISITSENESTEDAKIIIQTPRGGVEEKITSALGRIIYTPPSSGEYLVQAEKNDYQSDEKTFEAYNSFKLEFIPREPGVKEEILLKVRSQDGTPVYGAKVSLLEMDLSTNVEGEVRFSLPKPEEYVLMVEKEGFWNLSSELRVLYPLTLRLSSHFIEVGEMIKIDALGPDNEELSGVKFKIVDPDKEEMGIEEGGYKSAKVGEHEIYASKEGYKSQNSSFEVKPHPLEIEEKLQGGKIIIAVWSQGQPVSGITVVVSSLEEELNLITNGEGIVETKVREGKIKVQVNPHQENKNYSEKTTEGYVKKEYSFAWPGLIIILILLATFLAIKRKKSWKFTRREKEKEERTSIKIKRKGTSLGGT